MTKNERQKDISKLYKTRLKHIKVDLEDYMLYLNKLLQTLWKATLISNLHPKDKAEILRLLIFAFTVIFITALFVLNRF